MSAAKFRCRFLPGEVSPQAITTHLPGTLAGAFAALRAIVFHYDLAPDIAVFLDLQALIRVRRLAKESRLYDRQLKVEIAAEMRERRKSKKEWVEKKKRLIRMRALRMEAPF